MLVCTTCEEYNNALNFQSSSPFDGYGEARSKSAALASFDLSVTPAVWVSQSASAAGAFAARSVSNIGRASLVRQDGCRETVSELGVRRGLASFDLSVTPAVWVSQSASAAGAFAARSVSNIWRASLVRQDGCSETVSELGVRRGLDSFAAIFIRDTSEEHVPFLFVFSSQREHPTLYTPVAAQGSFYGHPLDIRVFVFVLQYQYAGVLRERAVRGCNLGRERGRSRLQVSAAGSALQGVFGVSTRDAFNACRLFLMGPITNSISHVNLNQITCTLESALLYHVSVSWK